MYSDKAHCEEGTKEDKKKKRKKEKESRAIASCLLVLTVAKHSLHQRKNIKF